MSFPYDTQSRQTLAARAAQAKYRSTHKEVVAARQKAYRAAHKAEARLYRQQHKEQLNEKLRVWQKENPESVRGYHRRRKYGLEPSQFETLRLEHGGLCAICRAPPKGATLCVDHDHGSGQVRGLLCDACNTALGLFQDQPHLLVSAATYLLSQKGV